MVQVQVQVCRPDFIRLGPPPIPNRVRLQSFILTLAEHCVRRFANDLNNTVKLFVGRDKGWRQAKHVASQAAEEPPILSLGV